MNTSLFLVSLSCEPVFYVMGADKRQWIHSYEVFASEAEARSFVKFQKTKYRVKSSRVESLNTQKIKKAVYYSGNHFISLDIVGKGGIFNGFKPKVFECQVRTFTNNEIKTLTLTANSPLVAECLEIQKEIA